MLTAKVRVWMVDLVVVRLSSEWGVMIPAED